MKLKKKRYQKPEVKQVKLVPEEAVLNACKLDQGLVGQSNRTCDHGACKKSVYGS